MGALMVPLRILNVILSPILRAGRHIAWFSLGIMTLIILYQVVMRYAFNAAPNWTEEAARFLMLWMTGLIAPSAYRWGGFVAIDMLIRMLPRVIAGILSLALLGLALLVLFVGLRIGWSEVTGFSGSFATASLWVPLDLVGGESFRMPRSWMMASLLVCIALLLVVNIELMLKSLIRLMDPQAELPVDHSVIAAGAE